MKVATIFGNFGQTVVCALPLTASFPFFLSFRRYSKQILLFVDEREASASPLLAIAGRVDPPGCSKTEALDLLGPMVVYPDPLGGVC